MRRRVLVDAWAWVALTLRNDVCHQRAAELLTGLMREHCQLLTTNLVVSESLTRLRYDASHTAAVKLADGIDRMVVDGDLAVVYIDAVDHRAALRCFRHYADQVFSFVDCTSFAVMERLGVTEAFTADRHFATAGFTPLA